MMNDGGTNNGGGGSNNWSRVCDMCRCAPSIVYCRADSAYLCSTCDETIHAANRVASRHERVWVCEACERAPAAFLCKADAASLCASCDSDIHKANPLASRHQRVPILPITGTQGFEFQVEEDEVVDEEEDEAEAASWLLPNPVRNEEEEDQELLFDEYLDLVDCSNSCRNNQFCNFQYDDHQNQQQRVNYDTVPSNFAVVPVQCGEGEPRADPVQQQSMRFQSGFDFDSSEAGFSYDGSLSQSVSISSMDVGVVLESTMNDINISISRSKSQIGTSGLFGLIPIMAPQFTPMDREARVLRYKEKKKTRKFEKKIRYASRKAYAETRPRIKGRFAKRTDVEAEVDQMLSTTLMTEAGCRIVPSF